MQAHNPRKHKQGDAKPATPRLMAAIIIEDSIDQLSKSGSIGFKYSAEIAPFPVKLE
jgi:hypothetical protein